MAPNLSDSSATLFLEASQQDVSQEKSAIEKAVTQKLSIQKAQSSDLKYQWKIVWRNVIALAYLHLGAFYGLYILVTAAKFYTFLWCIVLAAFTTNGVTAGAHRLWAHRAYKAKWPMRVILMLLQTMSFQNHIYDWVRNHRVHHKFMDTDADPHNAKRGFFFSHVGWLLIRKHPEVTNKGATIDMSDLEKDPVVVWQRRYYIVLMLVFCFLLPTWIPCHFWNEKPMYAWYTIVFRHTWMLNMSWLVNSAAHIWGMKPYDNTISATDSLSVGISAFGEGWHNYHHVFPWDYKVAELGNYRTNFSTAFIDFFAWIGWAYDLKTAAHSIIKKRAARTGDGSKYERTNDHDEHHEGAIWGWGDVDMAPEDMQEVEIINKGD